MGDQYLREFQDNEKTIPTILTTSQKLSTGVDARNIRNIVLMRPINSMIEFKQIIGRGTRLFEGKEYFTIYDFVEAYHLLCLSYYGKGMFDEPDKFLTAVLKGNFRYAEVVQLIGEKLIELGQTRLAYDKCIELLELEPDSIDVQNSLAWICGASDIKGIRDPAKALRFALKACEISDYKKPETVDSLAVAYAANGSFDKAVETAKKAIALARANDYEDRAERIEKRLELYKNDRVYIDPSLRSSE